MARKKHASKRKRDRVILAVDLFTDNRRRTYERATEATGLREVSEWVRRVLDTEAARVLVTELQSAESASGDQAQLYVDRLLTDEVARQDLLKTLQQVDRMHDAIRHKPSAEQEKRQATTGR